jgi:hypothetical protein
MWFLEVASIKWAKILGVRQSNCVLHFLWQGVILLIQTAYERKDESAV